MRHPHHMPPPLPNSNEIERAVRHLEAQIRAKHADTLAARISGMSKPGELEYQEPEHDPWTPMSWARTFLICFVALITVPPICLIAGIYFDYWAPPLIEFIKTAPWPRLG